MSLSNCIRIPLILPNVDIFTFGESNLFGYDSLNHCLIVQSLNKLNNINEKSIIYLNLLSKPKYEIRKLILNQDETILSLISNQTVYLVYLPPSNIFLSKNSCLCPLYEIPSLITDTELINNILIDFIWLFSNYFVIVNSIPSSSKCHLYIIKSSKSNQIKYLQTFEVESSIDKKRNSIILNKKISLNHSSNIIKLSIGKRKQNNLILIILLAIKLNGDIFLMEIEENQFRNNSEEFLCEFIGPICILPSTFDNYGAYYTHSHLICLSCLEIPIVIFTNDKNHLNQCIILNTEMNEYYLFTIDSINLSNNNQLIKLIIKDKLNSNIYYILDSLSNIYSIEISWINEIFQKKNSFKKTNIQHLIKSNHLIQQFDLIQTNNQGQFLAIIIKTLNNQQKELILIRLNSLFHSSSIESYSSIQSIESRSSIQSIKLNPSREFFDYILRILEDKQSLPHPIFSSITKNISNIDFENNLLNFIKIFSEEYIQKHEKIQIILENKRKYFYDFQQTQSIAYQELNEIFQNIIQKFQLLNQQYQQEYLRRKELSLKLNDLLSNIEQYKIIQSDAERLMYQQLERYQIQIKSLREKIFLFQQFILKSNNLNLNEQEIDQPTMEYIQQFIQYYKNHLYQMKQKLNEHIHQND